MEFKVGDWVRSYNQGIWRIERIITDYFEIRYSENSEKVISKNPIFILKRLVNDKWKRSLAMDSCSIEWVSKLNEDEENLLDEFIIKNEKTMKDFDKYERNVDLVLNLDFSILEENRIDFESIVNDLFKDKISRGLNSDEILKLILESELKKYIFENPIDKTVQFISINHEVLNSEIIFREFDIIDL